LACTYVELNRLDDANDAVKKQLELLPRHTVKWFARVPPFRLDEVRARILDGLRKAGMPEEQPGTAGLKNARSSCRRGNRTDIERLSRPCPLSTGIFCRPGHF